MEPLIRAAFARLPEVDVLLGPLVGAPPCSRHRRHPRTLLDDPRPGALVELLDGYTRQGPGLVESREFRNFLQVAGEPLRLNYAANRYGPYVCNLRHVLSVVAGHFLSGYGYGSAAVARAESLQLLPGAADEARLALAGSRTHHAGPGPRGRLRVALRPRTPGDRPLAGYPHPEADDAVLAGMVWDWSPRKARLFTSAHVGAALDALRSQGRLPVAAAS